jgi:hypothetical protein
MITIDEELLFKAIEGIPDSKTIKALVLACQSRGALIMPCETCQFSKYTGFGLWTSVKSALPKESGSYIVCTDKSEAFMTHFYADCLHWGCKSGDEQVKYWMKRPKTPWR